MDVKVTKKLISDMSREDISEIYNLVQSSQAYINGEISTLDIISTINWICSTLVNYDYLDPDLITFKFYQSEIDDIRDNVSDGTATQKDIDKYIELQTEIILQICKEIIEKYTPVLEELKKKHDIKPLTEEEELAKWWQDRGL